MLVSSDPQFIADAKSLEKYIVGEVCDPTPSQPLAVASVATAACSFDPARQVNVAMFRTEADDGSSISVNLVPNFKVVRLPTPERRFRDDSHLLTRGCCP